ncbi:MAG: hypothetical protein PHQ72_03460 [Hespellia sp.]|nr:hypothetical protein [Hespellia sp.]
MKVVQIVKKLNNTELGKGGTHDTYVLIPNDLDITDVFDKQNTPIDFTDKFTGEKVTVRNTVGREKRIVGLGQYYRNKDLFAGDEIIFEKEVSNSQNRYFVYTKKYTDNLVIQKSKYGFEILTSDRLKRFKENTSLMDADVDIEHLKSEKKRNDSPEKTDFYDVKIAGKSLMDQYSGKEVVEIQIKDNKIFVSGFYGWKKYVFETEE